MNKAGTRPFSILPEMTVPPIVHDDVRRRLAYLAEEKRVKIFYACESGSRAWGFASEDSDFDVRFLYAHREDHYFSINVENKRDVIEEPIEDHIDMSGWDLRKALQLMRKSNPPLLEWLTSPHVYRAVPEKAVDTLRELVDIYYSPTACLHHYFHMARGNFRDYLQGDIVWTKKYFYVLRPLLAMDWIRLHNSMPPMEFEKVMDVETIAKIRGEVMGLLLRKRDGEELDHEPAVPTISRWIREKMDFWDAYDFGKREKTPIEPLDFAFRKIVRMIQYSIW